MILCYTSAQLSKIWPMSLHRTWGDQENMVFVILLLIFVLTPAPIRAYPRLLPLTPAHSRLLPHTPAYSRTLPLMLMHKYWRKHDKRWKNFWLQILAAKLWEASGKHSILATYVDVTHIVYWMVFTDWTPCIIILYTLKHSLKGQRLPYHRRN